MIYSNWKTRTLAMLLAVGLAVSSAPLVRIQVHAENSLEDLKQEKKKAQDKVNDARSQANQAAESKQGLEGQLSSLAEKMHSTQQTIDDNNQKISNLQEELGQAQAQKSERLAAMKLRIRYMYELGDTNELISILFSSENFADFLAKFNYTAQLTKYEQKMIGELENLQREIDAKSADLSGKQDTLQENQTRLSGQRDELNGLLANASDDLKAKYGRSIEEILAALEDKQKELFKLQDYDRYQEELKKRLRRAEEAYLDLARQVSARRKQAAKKLCARVSEALLSLNFLSANFQMRFTETSSYTAGGIDEAEFYISTNPGEAARPLSQVASGGELSRIMLVIKTELAAREDLVDSLIFDEVDAGISGKTAQAVARKLRRRGREVQVICITHLPQIACMADNHLYIAKCVKGDATVTQVTALSDEERVREIARMASGDDVTEAALANAREMLAAAEKKKAGFQKKSKTKN